MKKRYRKILRYWILPLAFVLVVVGCRLPSLGPGPGLIVYVGEDENIYTIDRFGENQQAVTVDARPSSDQGGESLVYEQPTWSPDSNRVAFIQTSRRSINTRSAVLFTAQPDGSDLTETFSSEDQFPFYLFWSPDSQQLSFLTTGGSQSGLVLYMVPPRGGEARVLGTDQPFYWDWSPDSRSILIHTGGSTRLNPEARLALLDLDGELMQTNLPLMPATFQAPAWSPDGENFLLAAESNDGGADLLLTDLQGEILSDLSSLDDSIAFSWSPDGEWVAYVTEDNRAQEDVSRKLVILYPDDSEQAYSLQHDLVIAFFWSPDSQKIAYFVPHRTVPSEQQASMQVQDRQLSFELRVHDLRTGQTMRLIDFAPTEDFLNILPFFDQYQRSVTIWSPDSSNLVISAVDQDGEHGIYVIELSENTEARRIASGSLAFWSWE